MALVSSIGREKVTSFMHMSSNTTGAWLHHPNLPIAPFVGLVPRARGPREKSPEYVGKGAG